MNRQVKTERRQHADYEDINVFSFGWNAVICLFEIDTEHHHCEGERASNKEDFDGSSAISVKGPFFEIGEGVIATKEKEEEIYCFEKNPHFESFFGF